MNNLTLDEFIKSTYHTRLKIVIPALNTSVDKAIFVNKKGKYNHAKEYDYLKALYDKTQII